MFGTFRPCNSALKRSLLYLKITVASRLKGVVAKNENLQANGKK
jgi:hypothetical protein